MSEYKELPNPPGGSITCADGQFCTVEADDDGCIHASCHNLDPPDDGSGDGGDLMLGGGMGKGPSAYDAFIRRYRSIVKMVNGVDSVQVGNRYIPLYQLDKGLQIVTGVSTTFGGLEIKNAIAVAMKESFERANGNKVWFTFPVNHHRKEPHSAVVYRGA